MNQTQFVFVVPTYNSSKTLKQSLFSVFAQSYHDWKMIVIDDCSDDQTSEHIQGLFELSGNKDKLTLIKNDCKKWEVENTLIGLSHCSDNDVVLRLDLDDFLIDNQALEILNQIYESNTQLDVVWSAHRWFYDDELTFRNISGPLQKGVDPYEHQWVSSHLKSFRKSLLNDVKDENYRNQYGCYFQRIGDQVFMLPALKKAREYMYVPLPFYAYRCSQKPETFQSRDAKFQALEAQFLRSRGFVR